jgi:DNA-binding MarR family transcriptional regulator
LVVRREARAQPKRAAFEELVREARRSQLAADHFDRAAAEALGVNRTDMRCLDLLLHAGRLSAGQLAEAAGLTTGAMTAVLDRLERLGYARRLRDSADRRRVLVETTTRAGAEAGALHAEHAEMAGRLYTRYSAPELELLLDFLRQWRDFNEREAARLAAASA